MCKSRNCKHIHCYICNQTVKYISRHLRLHHPEITEKEYYDKYLKEPNEGFCRTCGKELPFRNLQSGYKKYCNESCEMKDLNIQKTIRDSYKNKTGYEHNFSDPNVIKQIKKTQEKIYGGVGFASEKIRQKALDNYNKKHNTNLISFQQLAHKNDKQRVETRKKNNGGNYHSTKAIKNFIKITNTPDAIKKRIENRWKNNPNYYSEEAIKKLQEKSLKTYAWANMKLFKQHNKGNCICHCGLCNNDYEINIMTLRTRKGSNKVLCTICNPLYSQASNNFTTSKQEKEVFEFIKSIYYGEVIENDRDTLGGNRELDVYLPELKIGIEYNGDYWHANPLYYKADQIVCEGRTAQELWDRDKIKKEICENKGIKLITIFETDWLNNRPEWEKIIKEAINDKIV